MRCPTHSALALVALAAPSLGNVMITNWCANDITIYQSHNGGCDTGLGAKCNSSPWTIAGNRNTQSFALISDGDGTSIKISNGANPGILQFEYTVSGGILYWDLSDIDGSGPAEAGSPFYNQNVKVTPTGDGVGTGTCTTISCPAGQTCIDAYNAPEQTKTRACPASTGDIWLDLCEPAAWFSQ